MKRRTAYLLAGAAVVAAGLVLSGLRPLTVIGGLPLALVLPGAALSALLFPRPGRLVTVERVLLIPALSLGTLIIGGLLAWAARAPLHRVTWLALSAGVTLAALLKPALAPAERSASGPSDVRRGPRPSASAGSSPAADRGRSRSFRQALPAALAVLLLAGAAWLSLATSIRSHRVTVTSLSVVPPGPADSSGDRNLQVTATGLSGGSAYALQVTSTSVNTLTSIAPDENGRWSSTLRLPANERLTLALFRSGQTTPMRKVIVASAATG